MKNERGLKALQRAIDVAGTQAELARRVAAYPGNEKVRNVKQAHVWNWLNRDGEVPDWAVLAVEAATHDEHGRARVLRCDLRADLYPEEQAAA